MSYQELQRRAGFMPGDRIEVIRSWTSGELGFIFDAPTGIEGLECIVDRIGSDGIRCQYQDGSTFIAPYFALLNLTQVNLRVNIAKENFDIGDVVRYYGTRVDANGKRFRVTHITDWGYLRCSGIDVHFNQTGPVDMWVLEERDLSIGEHKVKFVNDGIQVGCTFVSNKKIELILKEMQKRKK